MGIFSGKGFVGSCFRGWGSGNMAVQAVGCMIGMVVLVFVVLWYVVKFCLRIFDKHREKEESSRSVQNITMEMGYPNFNLGNYSVVLEQVNDAEALVAQLTRISGYSEELARHQVSSCPTCLMKGLDQEGADDMQVLLQVNDCSVVSVKDVGI